MIMSTYTNIAKTAMLTSSRLEKEACSACETRMEKDSVIRVEPHLLGVVFHGNGGRRNDAGVEKQVREDDDDRDKYPMPCSDCRPYLRNK